MHFHSFEVPSVYHATGELAFVVAEVNNTFGERYPYLLTEGCALPASPHDERQAIKRYEADKEWRLNNLLI